MLPVILAILCSSAISVTMKVSDRLGHSGYAILCVNYLFATVFSLLSAIRTGFPQEFPAAVIILGIVTGLLFLVTFILNQYNIIHNGAVMSATFMKMGIIVPIIMSRILWNERSSLTQTLGVLVAIIAILIMTIPEHASKENFSLKKGLVVLTLPLLLLSAGFADSTSKLYSKYGVAELSEWYLVITFITAFILCFPLMLRSREHFSLPKLGLGSVLGLVNYASTWFLLLAVARFPAYLVYPLVNVLTIAVISLICMTFFRERLSRRQLMGLVVVLAAVILLNL